MQPPATRCNTILKIVMTLHPPPPLPQGLRSCPVPPDVLKARNDHQKYLDLLDMLKSIEQIPIPKIEKEDSPAATEANEEEILV